MEPIPIIALLPVDTSGLPKVGLVLPTPSIDHVEATCDACGRACWIGPKQLAMRLSGVQAVCYFCLARAGITDADPVISLNPHIDKRPRR